MNLADSRDGLLGIGAFSRASLLSIKALRAYHEAGILVPARVDPATSYRYYHSSQLSDAAVVRRLRLLDLPLTDVREVVVVRDPEVTRRVLARHTTRMASRLDELSRVVDELQEATELPAAHTPVHVRDAPAMRTLAVRSQVTEADYATFLDGAYEALAKAATELGTIPSGPSGALYPPVIEDEGPHDVEAFVPLDETAAVPAELSPVFAGRVPATRAAVLVHTGSYETIGDAYRQLGAWVAHHGRGADLPVRESYLVSYGETDDPASFRTEIAWPIL